jgi:Reverse transcriptase (RNA-dependent DNA polymerase)
MKLQLMIVLPVQSMQRKIIFSTQMVGSSFGALQRVRKNPRMINQAKLKSYRRDPFWKFGVLVPCKHAQAVALDKANGNTKWQDAEATEKSQLMGCNTFINIGIGGIAPNGYEKIQCHVIYDVKHDGQHKAWLNAGGHLSDPNTESVYSGVVSLCGIWLIVFLAELNSLELWGADVGNAYLEALTKVKVYIIGGPEFGDLAGHTLLIFKALYGLWSSGLRWHQRFADVLWSTGFIQSKAATDIWMRENNGLNEYIAVYVDDLLIAARNYKDTWECAQLQAKGCWSTYLPFGMW